MIQRPKVSTQTGEIEVPTASASARTASGRTACSKGIAKREETRDNGRMNHCPEHVADGGVKALEGEGAVDGAWGGGVRCEM